MGCGCDLWRGCGRAIDRALGLGTRAHGHGGECGGSLRATRRPPKLRFSRTGGSAGCRTRTSLEWRANRDTESRRESHNHKHRQTGPHAHALFGPRHEASRGKKLLVLRAYMYRSRRPPPQIPNYRSNPRCSHTNTPETPENHSLATLSAPAPAPLPHNPSASPPSRIARVRVQRASPPSLAKHTPTAAA